MPEPDGRRGYAKRFYRVGEVCKLAGVESHVLRYWEGQFPRLRPRKSHGGQRLYAPADVELVLRIRDLLHVQGYTIAGARRRLEAADELGARDGDAPEAALDAVRSEIRAILTMLEGNDKL